MKSYVLIFGVFAFISINAINETAHIINNTDLTLHADVTIPSRTAAHIKFEKLHVPHAQSMLDQAIVDDSAENVAKAISAGAQVNYGKGIENPLIKAVVLRKSKAVEALLRFGAKHSLRYSEHTLIELAIKQQNVKTVIYLIQHGANFNDKINDRFNKTVMQFAIVHKSLELAQALIDRGYNIHNCDNGYESGYAESTGVWWPAIGQAHASPRMIDFFLENGANPNQILYADYGKIKTTPLLLAIIYNNRHAVASLLDAGADVNLSGIPERDGAKFTPLAYAIHRGYSNIIELLLTRGARA